MPKRKKNSNKTRTPLFLLVGGGIALIITAFLLINQNNQAQAPIAEEIPFPAIERVSLDEARSALENGSAVLLDVRSAEAFAGQHIAGAINIPTAELPARLSELDPNDWIIPYCT